VKENTEVLQEVEKLGKSLVSINQETTQYMSALYASGGLTEEQTTEASELLYIINDMDKMCDRCVDISKISGEKIFNQYQFSDMAVEELGKCFEYVTQMLQKTREALGSGDFELAEEIMSNQSKLRKMERKFKKNHIKRMEDNSCKAEMTGVFSGILHNLERIGNSCTNIAEEIMEKKITV
jgi:phosphate:Na+ symporter